MKLTKIDELITAVMKFKTVDGKKLPFDAEHSKTGFGIVVFPAEYGKYTRLTFIADDSGIIYVKDRGSTWFIENWEWDDPVQAGWERLD